MPSQFNLFPNKLSFSPNPFLLFDHSNLKPEAYLPSVTRDKVELCLPEPCVNWMLHIIRPNSVSRSKTTLLRSATQ